MPPPERYLRSLALILGLVLAGALSAQEEVQEEGKEAAPQQVGIRVVGDDDGLPRPGVLVYVPKQLVRPVAVAASGFLVAEDTLIERMRAAQVVRTDPEGRARIEPPRYGLEFLFAGEPHAIVKRAVQASGEILLRVVDREPVGVRVVDAAGKKLCGFPVALRGPDRHESVAVTGDDGQAILGTPKGFSARLIVMPALWVGPLDPFPTVAESVRGRRFAELKVPAYGSLRLRALRGGKPVGARLEAVAFLEPETGRVLFNHSFAGHDGPGVEFGMVAVGSMQQTTVIFDSQTRKLELKGPAAAGACVVHDVELGLQPKLVIRIAGPERAQLPAGTTLQVRVVTDAEVRTEHAQPDKDLRAEFSFRDGLRGSRLLRVELDLLQPAAGGRAAVPWSLVLPCDRPLAVNAVILDVATLVACPPQVRGKVVDENGAAVADARVAVQPAGGGPSSGYMVQADGNGAFAWTGARFRDAQGALVALVATAYHGDRRSERSAAVADGSEVTLVLRTAAAPRVARNGDGSVVARIRKITAEQARLVALVDGGGVTYRPSTTRALDDVTEFTFTRLRSGRYTLCGAEADLVRIPVLSDLDVPGDAACRDERLLSIGLLDAVRFVKVKVVDDQKVPIAGATVIAGVSGGRTDGAGSVRVALPKQGTVEAEFTAPGRRPHRCALEDGQVVPLDPQGTLTVTVKGLPDDLPRERLQVWVREEPRERLAGPKAPLGAGGVAQVSLPARGRYVLWLLITRKQGSGETSSAIANSPEPIEIGDAREQKAELQVDETAVARLRELLGKD